MMKVVHVIGSMLIFVCLSGVLTGLGGCASSSKPEFQSVVSNPVSDQQKADSRVNPPVRLMPGDQVEIKFAYAGQFNETEVIRPDGALDLQLVGEVPAAGKTPNELRNELMKRYAVELRHPELVVIVRSLYDRRIYVGGAVKTPGVVDMPGRLTVLEAILQSGGLDLDQADAKNVVVIRQTAAGRRNFLISFQDHLDNPEGPAFVLEPRDVVYVARTHIADVNLWVQQHIYKLLPPFTLGVGYSF
jgi:polysaccharide export outer membrane protein